MSFQCCNFSFVLLRVFQMFQVVRFYVALVVTNFVIDAMLQFACVFICEFEDFCILLSAVCSLAGLQRCVHVLNLFANVEVPIKLPPLQKGLRR